MLLLDVVQQHLRNFGFVGCAVLGCLLMGSLINQTPNIINTSVQLDKDFKCNDSFATPSSLAPSSSLSTNWTTNFIISFSAILPLIPLVLLKNPTTTGTTIIASEPAQHFQKTNAFMSHVLGQSATFAGNEFIKHFLISPDPLFFKKCNSSIELCLAKRLQHVPVFLAALSASNIAPAASIAWQQQQSTAAVAMSLGDQATANITEPKNQTFAFCSNSTLPINDIFASLHSMPNVVFSMIGASAILFLANIYLWKKSNLSSLSSNVVSQQSSNVASQQSNNNLQHSYAKTMSIANKATFHKPISYVKVFFVLIFCLFISAAFIYKQTQSLNNNFELLTSFLYGAGLQLLIFALFQWQYYAKNIATFTITAIPPKKILL